MKATLWPSRGVLPTVALVVVLAACAPAQRAGQAAEEIDTGTGAACTTERSTIEKAVESYRLLNPDAPVSEAAMVTEGFIHAQSQLMDITATGAVVPAAGSGCI